MKANVFVSSPLLAALGGILLWWGSGSASLLWSQSREGLVILDENGVRNLGIETAEVLETDFEDSVFAVGRIESIPLRRGVVSSRISGRIVELLVQEGDLVEKDQVLVRVESRQPGDPPPVIDIRAPIAGLVTDSHVRIGEPVEPDKEMLDITDLAEVYAVARVPEDRAGRLKPGTRAHIRVAALPDEAFEGELLRFGTAADRESGTLDALFKMPNESGRLRPDMRAEFSIVLGKRDAVMAVPREALQGDPANRVVFVRDFELPNAFVRAPVQIGPRNDRFVEIVNGLFPGDEVVTRGAYGLAFAGGGGISLKEALDAAHGHEHNADGSEMTAGQEPRDGEAGHDHEHEHEHGHSHGFLDHWLEGWTDLTLFFASTTGLLSVLLVLSARHARTLRGRADSQNA
ncbi:MAG: efflux RND transporter periplasmic adaptor subunit [Akkermansiaceae bacterium]|nr:efflux RND transporter periplasmic adaptor subunit [Akkermansiaceae bacterium]